MGIAIVVILKLAGSDFFICKAIGFGVIMWIVHIAIIPNLVEPRPYIFRTFNEAIVDLVSHITWGALTGWFIKINSRKNTA